MRVCYKVRDVCVAEKHKTFHQKDDMLSKDGFKKFMKHHARMYPECRYSKVSNHIHCVRAGTSSSSASVAGMSSSPMSV